MQPRVMRFAAFGGLFALMGGCGGSECVIPPCLPPFAATVTVTSTDGSPIHNATVAATSGGTVVNTMPCDGQCLVPGYAGKYDLTITAPGFRTSNLTITVTGKDAPKCGCPSVDTQHVDVKLTPA